MNTLHYYNYKSLVIFFAATVFLTLASCQKNEEQFEHRGAGIEVSLASADYSTKSSQSVKEQLVSYLLSDEGDRPLYLNVYRSRNSDLPFVTAPETKGSTVTKETLRSGADAFTMEGYLGDGKSSDDPVHFMDGVGVTYSSGSWALDSDCMWRTNVPTTFWSYYPASGATVNGSRDIHLPGDPEDKDAISFEYTLPSPATGAPFNDALNQQDILFAYNTKTWEQGQSRKVDVMFEHALSAIVLDVRDVSAEYNVTNVAFRNIRSGGSCDVSVTEGLPVFTWSDLGEALDYSQDFGDDDFDGGVQDLYSSGKVFFMIPQSLESGAAIAVTFTPADTGSGASAEVKSLPIDTYTDPYTAGAEAEPVAWEPGYVYTYELSYDPFTYAFNLEDISDSSQVFSDPTDPDDKSRTIPVSSRKITPVSSQPHGWKIAAVDGTPVAGDGTSYTTEDGLLSIVKDGDNLTVSDNREEINRGCHDYWTGGNGSWSPVSWGADGLNQGVIDLSRNDVLSNDSGPVAHTGNRMSTANCYIIRHAGTYKIPLVYGNAIKNSEVNRSAYYANVTGTDNLNWFLDCNNREIHSYAIENHTTSGTDYLVPETGARPDNALDIDGASVLWQEFPGVISIGANPITGDRLTSGRYSRLADLRYVEFSVNQDMICQTNAIIAVKDGDKVVWSWHIWVTNDPDAMLSQQSGFHPLPCLGWIEPSCYDKKDQVTVTLVQEDSGKTLDITVNQPPYYFPGTGTYYQFGRKDPMPSKEDVTNYTINEDYLSIGVTLGAGIRRPNYFFTRDYDHRGDWCSSPYGNLWTGSASGEGVKTIYDPSPLGYKVPATAAFDSFCDVSGECNDKTKWHYDGTAMSLRKGYVFLPDGAATIFLPAAGFRSYGNEPDDRYKGGKISRQGQNGFYWTSSPQDSGYGYGFGFASSYIHVRNRWVRGDGLSIRPAKDPAYTPDEPVRTFTLTGPENYDFIGASSASDDTRTIDCYSEAGTPAVRSAADWRLEYSLDDGASYSSTKPSWVNVAIGEGSDGAGRTVTVGVTEITARSTVSPKQALQLMPEKTAFDLSGFNPATGQACETSTANTYVVNSAGTYTFPVVYGNALKNGEPNTKAYKPGTGTNPSMSTAMSGGFARTYYMQNFLDYNDQPISSPYILHGKTGTFTAGTLWSDVDNLVTDVNLNGTGDDACISFTVSKENIDEGSAVIYLADSSGTIVWSWQIWVNPSDLSKTVSIRNKDGQTHDFMSINLGWEAVSTASVTVPTPRSVKVRLIMSYNGEDKASKEFYVNQSAPGSYVQATDGRNTFYQWGRKDPIVPGGCRTVYNTKSGTTPLETITYGGKTFVSAKAVYASSSAEAGVTIGQTIKAPYIHYCSYWQAPTKYDILNLWNGAADSQTYTGETQKTVYDPSPVGFVVPPANAFTGFIKYSTGYETEATARAYINASGSFDPSTSTGTGWKFYTGGWQTGETVSFALSGNRDSHQSHWSNRIDADVTVAPLQDEGRLWTSAPSKKASGNSNVLATGLVYHPTWVKPKHMFDEADATSVRAVKE